MKTKHSDQYLIHVLEIVGNAIVGGVEQYVHYLVKHLPSRGYKITCVFPYESAITARMRDLGSLVNVTAMEDNPPWRSIQFLTELVRYQQVDVIHSHLSRAHVLAGLVGCLTETPVVMTVHGMDITSWDLGIQRTSGSTLNVVCQAAYAQALSLGVSPEQVRCIPNGVDLSAFRSHLDGAAFRKAYNIPPAAPLVGFVGRLAFEKGPDMFIQLAQYVHRLRPEVHFVLVGDGPLRAELVDQVTGAGLENHVHLAGTWAQMREVYPALDVLVQTSRVEGMPFTLLEGMASGLPVAAMGVGGVPEIVEVGTAGFLSAVGDWAGLGDAVIRLIEQPDLRKKMGRAARRLVEQKFDLNTTLELLNQEFRALLQASDPPSGLEPASAILPKNLDRNDPPAK